MPAYPGSSYVMAVKIVMMVQMKNVMKTDVHHSHTDAVQVVNVFLKQADVMVKRIVQMVKMKKIARLLNDIDVQNIHSNVKMELVYQNLSFVMQWFHVQMEVMNHHNYVKVKG